MDNNNDGIITPSTEIIQEKNYYPFGLRQIGYNGATSSIGNDLAQKWGYNGKEYQDDLVGGKNLNWHDFGARNYDATIGRWFVIDPKADDIVQVDLTPYNYSWNNPSNVSDPDGECPWCWGAVIGAAIEYGSQVANNYAQGKTGVDA
ncbi:RHS repeat-associated core domain-containing protein [Tenacibaculum sp. FZY0031]|uniref:RHS repeat domain-containing protein n=1 Tax=Tenacibaculum sp. FZY0031 TaxID=3116648 RepID=UPI002EA52BEE|nr:RHS repeat-associated core domain-containing protein [Tenacibaculum sp. FZY0031]